MALGRMLHAKGLVAVLTAATAMAAATASATAEPAADVEIADVFGAGGQASFQSETWIDEDLCILTEIHLQVTVASQHAPPGGPSSSPKTAAALTQSWCDGSELLFEGRGVATDMDFQLGANLGSAALQATLVVPNSTSESSRIVAVNVAWTPAGAAESLQQNEHDAQPGGPVVNAHHDGTVRQVSASGEILVSDPLVEGEPIQVTGPSLSAALWDTSGRRITVTPGQPGARAASASQAATCTGGTWGGYWTWVTNPAPARWVWTWVWYPCSGGFVAS